MDITSRNNIILIVEIIFKIKKGELMPKADVPKERTFLHDISNQLVVAHGMGHYVLDMIKESDDVDEKVKDRMQKVIASVDQIVLLIRKRQEIVRLNDL